MDSEQNNHLKSYGLCFSCLDMGQTAYWLLNYRGGSFVIDYSEDNIAQCKIKSISYEVITEGQFDKILRDIQKPEVNMDAVKLEKAPKIAVYTPSGKKPWDDAVTLALSYAEINYDIVYDDEIMDAKLSDYDWLHLHHEDFTGQFGKFYTAYKNMKWYKDQVQDNQNRAEKYGFTKVSELKKAVSHKIKAFVADGGFLFAMCSATDTFDISLAAHDTDICMEMYDGDDMDPHAQEKLDYNSCFAFHDFVLETNPNIYEYSDIDVTQTRKISKENDYFALFEFSAKWDPVPTMLCQNHTRIIRGFMGQTTAFNKKLIKSNVIIMGENQSINEARYIHGKYLKGTWTFYGGHDPEDYQHLVGDPPTELKMHKNSPGYRLILNNILFPAAKKKKLKT
jgi:hypothetical protein